MKRNKFLPSLIALVLVILSCFSVLIIACNKQEDNLYAGFRYKKLHNGTYSIVGYEGTQTRISVPSYIDGTIVTRVEERAFKDCSSLETVSIPETVDIIGMCAFEGCSSLQSLTLPFVEYFAHLFASDMNTERIPQSLKDLTILNSCTRIRTRAFTNCKILRKIYIPASVLFIDDGGNSTIIGTNGIVSNVTLRPFYGCSSELEIFCEYKQAPNGWDTHWNYIDGTTPLTVHWGRPCL